ncbi:hypothetical protein KFK09_022766 [Dendrobium nobile]|uniref:Uncharacterized protein n=1 Tax=Dendrobium nobile TaxID=94219 RepID=A0A8T3AJ92_DENNO|nr:hypothetical protein KFK09_022766 [Dendrobium nobile]
MVAPKYGSKIEEESKKRNVSSSWKIIIDGGKALHPFLKWSVANGSLINVFEDKWLLDRSINKWPTCVVPQREELVMLHRFIEDKEWNVAELLKMFGSEMVKLISHTKIKPDLREDVQEMIHQNLGKMISGMIAKAR